MHNIQASPTASCPRLTSLDPRNLPGTTSISSSYTPTPNPNRTHHHQRQPKRLLTLSPPSPPSPTITPAEKLDRLLSTITSVLTSYARLEMRSGVYMRVLQGFYERGLRLAGQRVGREKGRGRGFFDEDDRDGVRGDVCEGEREGKGAAVFVIDGEKVDELERDWWGSEVVVTWYGPRPGMGRGMGRKTECIELRGGDRGGEVMGPKMGTRATGLGGGGGTEREVFLKRDASFLGLGDE